LPIHPRWLKVLRSMTDTYCKGKLKTYGEGVPTCPKARSVFYATMRAKKIDYTTAPSSEEVIQEVEQTKVDEIIQWFEETLLNVDIPEDIKQGVKRKKRRIVDEEIVRKWKKLCQKG